MKESTNINEILAARGARYGMFKEHAKISQDIKDVMKATVVWDKLEDDQIKALEMVDHKIARILNGDPNYSDNWVDIAGYATLVANRLEIEDNAA